MSARFPSAEILRRLGAPEPNLFDAHGGELVPTMTVLDLSRSLASEPVEARGYARATQGAVAGQFSTWNLIARAPGGIIVERMILESPDTAAIGTAMAILPRISSEPLPAGPEPLSIGGLSIQSSQEIGATVVLQPGAPLVPWQDIASFNRGNPLERIYVPTGSVLCVQPGAATVLIVSATWRELPEIQA